MRKIWNWIEDNAGPIAVTIAILGGFAAIIQFSVVRPMHQGFDAVNQRIDDQITYIHQHFDDQNISINQRFDDRTEINQRFDAVNHRFDAVNQRFDDQDDQPAFRTPSKPKYPRFVIQSFTINQRKLDAVNQRTKAFNQRIDDQITYIHQHFDDQNKSITSASTTRAFRRPEQINQPAL